MVDDYLIKHTQGTMKTDKGPKAPKVRIKKRKTGTYWDKKTEALWSDRVAKTNPVRYMY